MRCVFAAALACLAAGPVAAQPGPKDLDVVPRDAFGFVTVKVADLWDAPTFRPVREAVDGRVAKLLEENTGVAPADLDRVTLVWPMFFDGHGADQPVIAVSTRKPFDRAKVLKALRAADPRLGPPPRGPFASDTPPPPAKFAGPPPFYTTRGFAVIPVGDRTIVLVPVELLQNEASLLALTAQLLNPAADGPLAGAVAAAGKHTLVAGFQPDAPTALLKRNPLPRDAAGFAPLLDAKLVVVTADVGKSAAVTVRVTLPDAGAAKKAADAVRKLTDVASGLAAEKRKSLAGEPDVWGFAVPLHDFVLKGLGGVKVAADGAEVVATAESELSPALIKGLARLPEEWVKWSAVANEHARAINNLKQIGLALFNYEAANGHFPNNITYKDGKPLLSWRVHLLPYLDQAELHKKFKLDEPWDSANNKPLVAAMPAVFAIPNRAAAKGETYLQSFAADEAGDAGSPFLVPGRKLKIGKFVDGLSNTVAVAEAADAVVWSKPADLKFDPKNLPKLGGGRLAFLLLADGSVRSIVVKDLTPELLKALITIDGGEPVTFP